MEGQDGLTHLKGEKEEVEGHEDLPVSIRGPSVISAILSAINGTSDTPTKYINVEMPNDTTLNDKTSSDTTLSDNTPGHKTPKTVL